MTGVVLGIITALLWGSADILSSLAARYVGAWRVTLLAQASGCLALAGGGLFLSWRFPQEHFFTALPSPLFGVLVLHAIVLGALAAGGYVALYRSLAQGPLALVSPQPTEQSRCWQPSCSPASRSIWKKALCWRSSC